MPSVTALRRWLVFVALLRLFSGGLGWRAGGMAAAIEPPRQPHSTSGLPPPPCPALPARLHGLQWDMGAGFASQLQLGDREVRGWWLVPGRRRAGRAPLLNRGEGEGKGEGERVCSHFGSSRFLSS